MSLTPRPGAECAVRNPDFRGGARALPPKPYPSRARAADGAEGAHYDDGSWRGVALPHDFVVEGEPCFVALGCNDSSLGGENGDRSGGVQGLLPKTKNELRV